MDKKFPLLFILFCTVSLSPAFGQGRDARMQQRKGFVSPQEIVSLDSTMRFDQALLVLNELSKQFANKVIIDLEKRRAPIGVYIVNQPWRDALETILTRWGLWYEEESEFIRIVSASAVTRTEGEAPGAAPAEPPPTLESRDVRISAVFFAANVQKLQEYGISWNFFRSKPKEASIDAYSSIGIGAGDTLGDIPPTPKRSLDKAFGVVHSPPEFKFANIDALVKFFGTDNLGEVITSPEVVVRNGKKGKIQVGRRIYVTVRDFAGNTINEPVETGTIIEVTPTVYAQSDTSFIHLDLAVEQSDASPGPIINKTMVKTYALLYNGEETVIGGLFTTVDQNTREGIPILKDLPGWFLGLRYLFGSERILKNKQELIILLKAELLPSIRDRINQVESMDSIIKNKRREFDKRFQKEPEKK